LHLPLFNKDKSFLNVQHLLFYPAVGVRNSFAEFWVMIWMTECLQRQNSQSKIHPHLDTKSMLAKAL